MISIVPTNISGTAQLLSRSAVTLGTVVWYSKEEIGFGTNP